MTRTGSDPARAAVRGALDTIAGERLVIVCSHALADGSRRLELDLSGVTSVTPAGSAAVGRCLVLARRLPNGFDVTVATDAGRRVLLDALSAM